MSILNSVAKSLKAMSSRWHNPAREKVKVKKELLPVRKVEQIKKASSSGTVFARAGFKTPWRLPDSVLYRGRNKRKGWVMA